MSVELDELDYLSPSFDPSSLTVPKLRNILLTHQVEYPSSAKKPQLIQLFNENVVPQAKKILSARSKTKRSARGIVDVPSSQVSTVDEEDAVEEEKPKPKRGGRRTTTRQLEPEAETTPITDGPSSRGRSVKHTQASEVEPEEKPKKGRPRKSVATPVVKEESKDPATWHRYDDDSPFTNENPFQSGSSPPPPIERPDKRRKTLDPEQKEKRKSTAGRRKTEVVKREEDGDIKSLISTTVEVPVSRIAKKYKQEPKVENGDVFAPGEEFTPEEALELEQTGDDYGQAVIPTRRIRSRGSGALKSAVTALLVAGLAGFGYIWRQEKIEVGYCGVGRPSESLAGIEIPDWAKVLQPQCELCPPHAYCYSNLRTTCEPGFILQNHPLSLGGVIPLPPTCEPDGEKAKRVKAVADRAVEELRSRNAAFECGELTDTDGKPAPSPEINEETLKATLSAKKRKGMSDEEFEALWEPVIGEILNRDEITSGVDGHDRRTLRSSSLAKLPLRCALRLAFRRLLIRAGQSLVEHRIALAGALTLALSGAYARYSVAANRRTEEHAKQLASYALDRLATQASLHAQDPDRWREAYIAMGRLRDDVLREEFSATRRGKLWGAVQKKVEANSNIRPMVREDRHGDVSRVWEWVGAVRAVDDGSAAGSGRRADSRLSLGSVVGSSPPSEGQSEMTEVRNWEESRPIY